MIIDEVSKNKKLFGTGSHFLKFLQEIWTLTEFWSFLNIVLGCTNFELFKKNPKSDFRVFSKNLFSAENEGGEGITERERGVRY